MAKVGTALQFRIEDMNCAEEIILLRQEIGPIVGDEDRLLFDILNRKMTVGPGQPHVSAEAVMQAVACTGMRAQLVLANQRPGERLSAWQRQIA